MRHVRLPRRRSVIRCALVAVGVTAALGVPAPAAPRVKHYPLASIDGLRVQNVATDPADQRVRPGRLSPAVRSDARRPPVPRGSLRLGN